VESGIPADLHATADLHLTRTQRARREDIVTAAVMVLDRDGYSAASVDRIAAAAQTSKSTVLYHFRTKEAIYEAVIGALRGSGAACMRQRIRAAASHRLTLRGYLTANLRFIAAHAAHVNAVHRILENTDIRVDGTEVAAPLRELFTAGQRVGEFRAFDPEVMALAVRAFIDGAAFHFTVHPGLDVEHYIDEAVEIFDRATAP
jgi:AcrR family transcriptional regulator